MLTRTCCQDADRLEFDRNKPTRGKATQDLLTFCPISISRS
jgi:hypothetical protein